MANCYTNSSYERCMEELRARYSKRGVNAGVKHSSESVEKIDEEISFERVSFVSDEYRSGSYNGNKYMTSDDFIRYFRKRSAYNMPLALRDAELSNESRVNESARVPAAQRRQSTQKGGLVKSESGSKEGNLIDNAVTFVKQWFPVEPREGREEGTKFKLPARALASMAAAALSLVLIVSGSVMVGKASGEVGSLNSQITRLEAKETELRNELDQKYNVQEIEKDATALGMIKNEFADKQYLEVADEEKIEIFEEEKKDFSFAALLSAFGIDID